MCYKSWFLKRSLMSYTPSGTSLSCKSLFLSGKSSKAPERASAADRSQIQHTLHIECNIAKVKAEVEKEQHQKRVDELKQLLTDLEQDSWKYKPIDDLIGLTSL